MKLISKEFDKLNFHFKQIHREGNLAVYERFWLPSEGEHKHWEVIKILHTKARKFPDGRFLPEQESYPSDTHWGVYGFTCTTKESAFKRFDKMKEHFSKTLRKKNKDSNTAQNASIC